jgi:hypothetical protein
MAFLERNANSGSVSTGYDIDNSVKLEADNSEFFSKTPDSNSNRQTFTFSTWIKRTELGAINAILEAYQDGSNFFLLGIQNDDMLVLYDAISGTDYGAKYSIKLKDTAAWYHIVFKSDTTNGTAASRWQVYVNGVELTAKTTDYGTPPQNYNSNLNRTIVHNIGKRQDQSTFMSCYLAETHLVDGTALAPTAFGEFDEASGIWKPIEVEDVTYGTNGFYLDYADASDLGDDESGNGNDFAENNIAAADQATDTPTNNFAILNILHAYSGTTSHNPIINEGATRWTTGRAGYWATGIATIGITSGKWYFEVQPGTSNSHITGVGYGDESDIHDWGQNIADTHGFLGETSTNSIGYLGSDTETTYGNVFTGTGSKSGAANSANYTISNIVGVAIDADNGYIYFAKDNTYINSGNPASGSNGTGGDLFEDTTTTRTGTVFAGVTGYHHTAPTVMNVNFGGYTTISISSAATDANGYGTFEYAPPSGYYALCTKNLEVYG